MRYTNKLFLYGESAAKWVNHLNTHGPISTINTLVHEVLPHHYVPPNTFSCQSIPNNAYKYGRYLLHYNNSFITLSEEVIQ